eukprot:366229-Chlamydomonas_euryale.AAC.4
MLQQSKAMMCILTGMYGARELVNQYVAQVIATLNAFKGSEPRLATFQKCLDGVWSPSVLSVYIDGMRKLAEPARLPCIDFPADFSPRRYSGPTGADAGDWSNRVCVLCSARILVGPTELQLTSALISSSAFSRAQIAPALIHLTPTCSFHRRGGEPVADVRKCLWVADKLLFKRHNKTAYAFAAALALKGEPVTDAELSQFFVAPGYYGPDVATMQAYERSRAEFRRVPVHMFLEELCKEYIRCEKVLFDLLPQLFSRWDSDGDGLMKRSDISSMLEHMAQKGTPLQELEAEADAFWTRMVSSDASSADGGNAPAVGDAIAVHSDNVPMPAVMLSCAAFMQLPLETSVQAAPQSSTLRAYVRLYKTPPARVRNNFSTEEQVSWEDVYCCRHGTGLLSFHQCKAAPGLSDAWSRLSGVRVYNFLDRSKLKRRTLIRAWVREARAGFLAYHYFWKSHFERRNQLMCACLPAGKSVLVPGQLTWAAMPDVNVCASTVAGVGKKLKEPGWMGRHRKTVFELARSFVAAGFDIASLELSWSLPVKAFRWNGIPASQGRRWYWDMVGRRRSLEVREMSDTMVKEQDGMRKALMLHALLKVMINQRLDRLIEQVTPSRNSSSTTSALHPEFESGLLQLTTAVKHQLICYRMSMMAVRTMAPDWHRGWQNTDRSARSKRASACCGGGGGCPASKMPAVHATFGIARGWGRQGAIVRCIDRTRGCNKHADIFLLPADASMVDVTGAGVHTSMWRVPFVTGVNLSHATFWLNLKGSVSREVLPLLWHTIIFRIHGCCFMVHAQLCACIRMLLAGSTTYSARRRRRAEENPTPTRTCPFAMDVKVFHTNCISQHQGYTPTCVGEEQWLCPACVTNGLPMPQKGIIRRAHNSRGRDCRHATLGMCKSCATGPVATRIARCDEFVPGGASQHACPAPTHQFTMRQRIEGVALTFLGHHRGVRRWLQQWRANARKRSGTQV